MSEAHRASDHDAIPPHLNPRRLNYSVQDNPMHKHDGPELSAGQDDREPTHVSVEELKMQFTEHFKKAIAADNLIGVALAAFFAGSKITATAVANGITSNSTVHRFNMSFSFWASSLFAITIQLVLLYFIWIELPTLENDPTFCRNKGDVDEKTKRGFFMQVFGIILFFLNTLYAWHEWIENFNLCRVIFTAWVQRLPLQIAVLPSTDKNPLVKIHSRQIQMGCSKANTLGKLLLAILITPLTFLELIVIIVYLVVGCRYLLVQDSAADLTQAAVSLTLINQVDNVINETLVPKFIRDGIQRIHFLQDKPKDTVERASKSDVFDLYMDLHFVPRIGGIRSVFLWFGLASVFTAALVVMYSLYSTYCFTASLSDDD